MNSVGIPGGFRGNAGFSENLGFGLVSGDLGPQKAFAQIATEVLAWSPAKIVLKESCGLGGPRTPKVPKSAHSNESDETQECTLPGLWRSGSRRPRETHFGLFWGSRPKGPGDPYLENPNLLKYKEVRPSFLGDTSTWSFPTVSSLSDCSTWRF